MAPDPQAALSAAYRDQVAQVRSRVLLFVAATWFALGNWRDRDVDEFVALVVPRVIGGQRTIASLTTGYLASLAVLHFGGRLRPADVDPASVTGAAVRRGTDPAAVYRRAGEQVWTALSRGQSLEAAVLQGVDRAQEAAATDLQLAKTHTSAQVLAQDRRKPTGYRRVLEGDSSCGLCALAATQRYTISELMPIHPACDCSVAPLYGWNDRVLDPAEAARIHDLAQQFFGDGVDTFEASKGSHSGRREYDFRDFVVVHDHGELGPVLGRKGQQFTGPDELGKRPRPAPEPRTEADTRDLQITQLRERIPGLADRVAAGDATAQAALDWSQTRLAALTG
ncbi:MAG: hypothetical protein AB7I38_14410 [Dehalococcoidia bacterium]